MFYNTLTNHEIGHKNYEHALNGWKAFKINTSKYYYDFYWKADVLLLACVYEIFRKEPITSSELTSAHYSATPSYNWDPVLRFTDANLKLISDTEKYQFIENQKNMVAFIWFVRIVLNLTTNSKNLMMLTTLFPLSYT